MYQINQFPPYNASFFYLGSSTLGLDQEQQFGATEQQPIYQGIPVRVLKPISIYNSGLDTYQNEADHSNSLIKYNIESLTNFDSENASGTGIQEIPQSILDEYVPYQNDYEPVNNPLLLTPGTSFQQLISWDELEIREQTTVNNTSSGLQLTNLPAGIHSSQDLRPVAVVNPLYMHQATSDNQTTQAEVNVDGSSSLAERKRERKKERQRELRKDPAYVERERERRRELRKDPAYVERERERRRELRKDPAYVERERERRRKLRKDPAYAERERERRRELRKDPAYVERERERRRKLRKDPAYAERQRERQRELRKDPAYVERQRERRRERYQTDPAYAERQRERQKELRKDPAYVERERERRRGRYQTDPAYAEREKERKRERYQTDPAYAERKREHDRERYQTDLAYAERKRERARERYQTDPAYAERRRELRKDPAYAEGQKIYKKIYQRIKIQTSNKEEAKEQAVIARERYLQSVHSAKNSGDLPLTANLAETTQSSEAC